MSNVYQPPVVPGWAEATAGPLVAVAVALFRHRYLFYGRRTSSTLYGTPGGNTQGGETPRAATKRIVLEDTGMDLGTLYLPYQGIRELPISGGVMPVRLFLGLLDLNGKLGAKFDPNDPDGARDDNNGIVCPDRNGFPRCQSGGRHQAWACIHADEANAQPQKYSPALRWALEIYCRKAPTVRLPWDHEAVPLAQAAHVQELAERE